MKKVLVTGSSGSIGTALSEALLKEGYELTGADIRPNEWNKEIDEKTVRVDLTDKEKTLALLPKNIEVILHLAAHSRVWDLAQNPALGGENMLMLENVLEFAKTNGIKKIIFASSREVYGNLVKDSYSEEDASLEHCENAYAESKLKGEEMLHVYRASDIDSVILRFANVYGKYDTHNRVVPLFIAHCLEEKPIRIFGTGKILDFVYIDDAVSGIMLALHGFNDLRDEAVNIASGEGTDLADLANMLKALTGADIQVSVEDNRTGEVMRYVGNIEKAKRLLGFSPAVSLKEGLRRTVQWYGEFYRAHPDRMPKLRN